MHSFAEKARLTRPGGSVRGRSLARPSALIENEWGKSKEGAMMNPLNNPYVPFFSR